MFKWQNNENSFVNIFHLKEKVFLFLKKLVVKTSSTMSPPHSKILSTPLFETRFDFGYYDFILNSFARRT